jgi:hypothetical protein
MPSPGLVTGARWSTPPRRRRGPGSPISGAWPSMGPVRPSALRSRGPVPLRQPWRCRATGWRSHALRGTPTLPLRSGPACAVARWVHLCRDGAAFVPRWPTGRIRVATFGRYIRHLGRRGRRIKRPAADARPGARPRFPFLVTRRAPDRLRLGTLEHLTPRPLGLAVSPEGGTILYPRLTSSNSDLMLIENFR